MNKGFSFVWFFWGCFFPMAIYAQEEQELDVEQSAEVFLEAYSDDFQENFFEGLKQKGIQNYDRAITYFLECKRLQPENKVVAFELAKSHLLDKELILAQEYALEAVNGNPENYWYAETLTDVVEARKSALEAVTGELPWNNTVLRGNMAEIYFYKGNYQTAKSIVTGLKGASSYERLQHRIFDSIAKQELEKEAVPAAVAVANNGDMSGMEAYKTELKAFMLGGDNVQLILQSAEEAMELFPVQPYFYYANGYGLNRTQKHEEAIEMLETALDFLIDDVPLENAIYEELAKGYTGLDDPAKANMYLSKIKPGF